MSLPGDGTNLTPHMQALVDSVKAQGGTIHFRNAVVEEQANMVAAITRDRFDGDCEEAIILRADGSCVVSLCGPPKGATIAGDCGNASAYREPSGVRVFEVKNFARGTCAGFSHAMYSPDGKAVDVRIETCGCKGPRIHVTEHTS